MSEAGLYKALIEASVSEVSAREAVEGLLFSSEAATRADTTRLETGLNETRADIARLETGLNETRADIARLETGLNETRMNLARVESRLDAMATKEDFARLESRLNGVATKESQDKLEIKLLKWFVGGTIASITITTSIIGVFVGLFLQGA